jgi:hypothetical protein
MGLSFSVSIPSEMVMDDILLPGGTLSAPGQSTNRVMASMLDQFCHPPLHPTLVAGGTALAAMLCNQADDWMRRGQPNVWVCGILHAIAKVNHCFDPSHPYAIQPADLYQVCGVSAQAAQRRSRQICDRFQLDQDPQWQLPLPADPNPWMVSVSGLAVDVRLLPPALQAIAQQRGLMPHSTEP